MRPMVSSNIEASRMRTGIRILKAGWNLQVAWIEQTIERSVIFTVALNTMISYLCNCSPLNLLREIALDSFITVPDFLTVTLGDV